MPHPYITALLLTLFTAPVIAADAVTPADTRIMVEMPAASLALMRQDMLSHLSALNSIVAALGKGDPAGAADIAEQQLGRASMGKHQGSGKGPGRFMPVAMRDIGWRMHDAADEFAAAARSGDIQHSYAALEPVITACVSCHAVYRTR